MATDFQSPSTPEAAAASQPVALKLERYFTEPGVAPFDTVEWELRTASVGKFEQKDVEFPKTW